MERLEEAFPTWTRLARLTAAFEDPSLSSCMIPYKKEKDEPVVNGKGHKKGAKSRGGSGAVTVPPPLPKAASKELWLAAVRPDDFLADTFGEFRSSEAGQQEDAQEFLDFLLNRLHNEIIAAQKKAGGPPQESGVEGEVASPAATGEEDGGEWQEIGECAGRVVRLLDMLINLLWGLLG